MAKDLIKEGITFALGMARISGQQFGKVVRRLERTNKVSSKEGEKMVYAWLADQQKQLEKMKKRLKREAVKTRVYTTKDLKQINTLIRNLSKEILALQKKKKKAEAAARKKKGIAVKKRTAKRRTVKRKTKRKPAKRKAKRKKR